MSAEPTEQMEPLELMQPIQAMEPMTSVEPEVTNDGFNGTETQKVTKPDGTIQEISVSSDGVETQKSTLPDGTTIETRSDGVKIQVCANGTTIETHKDGYRKQINASGIVMERFPDGRTMQVNPAKGSTIERFPDGSSKNTFANGAVVETSPDGVKTQTNPNGNVIVIRPDGTRTQTNVDGTVFEKLADGTQVTRAPGEGAASPKPVAETPVTIGGPGGPGTVESEVKIAPTDAMAAMSMEANADPGTTATTTGAGTEVAEDALLSSTTGHPPVTVGQQGPEGILKQPKEPASDPPLESLESLVEEPLQRIEPIKVTHNTTEEQKPLNLLGGMTGAKDPTVPDLGETAQKYEVVDDKSKVKNMCRTPDGGANTEFVDGVKTREFGDGTVVQDYPDGTKLIMNNRVKRTMKPNGYTIDRYSDGRVVENHPDGTVIEIMANGIKIQENPDGTKEQIELDGTKTEVMKDGTVKVTKGNVISKDFPQFRSK